MHSQVQEKILFRTFKDWLRSLTPDSVPRDKKGSALLPKDISGFKTIGKMIFDQNFSYLGASEPDKLSSNAVEILEQYLALFAYFNRSDKPEYKCLGELQWLIKIAKGPMYEYKQQVKDKFFFDACFSVLFTLFAKTQQGQQFTRE